MEKISILESSVKKFKGFFETIGFAPSAVDIIKEIVDIGEMLINKNISYGDSALSPSRIFAKSDSQEQIKVRIDDKLNRIKNNQSFIGDNDVDDLIGYLILLKIAMKRSKE